MLYQDIPKKFRWDKKHQCWVRYTKFVPSIGRMVHCSPKYEERFYLRLMLCYRKGPTSFEDLRTVDGVVYPSYREAGKAAGHLKDDNEWNMCMTEAATFKMPSQLRLLFVTILVYSLPGDVKGLWKKFLNNMSKDCQHQCQAGPTDEVVEFKTLRSVETLLQANGKELSNISGLSLMSKFREELRNQLTTNRLVDNERSAYSVDMLERILAIARERPMNTGQQNMFDQVVSAVNMPNPEQKLLFIDGPGGTGKSFLLEQILATVPYDRKIAIAAASS